MIGTFINFINSCHLAGSLPTIKNYRKCRLCDKNTAYHIEDEYNRDMEGDETDELIATIYGCDSCNEKFRIVSKPREIQTFEE